ALAESYVPLGIRGRLPPREVFPKARSAAEKALEIDDTLAQAYAALAECSFHYDWDLRAADRQLRKALELNPNYSHAHRDYAGHLSAMGRHDEAFVEIKRAEELDPLSLFISQGVGSILSNARRYDEAIQQFQKTLQLDANYVVAHSGLAEAYAWKGMVEEALAEARKTEELSESGPGVLRALVYGVTGRKNEARVIIRDLEERSKQTRISPRNMAALYAVLGEKDSAFAWLEKAFEERMGNLHWINVEPEFDSLRSDPRFQELLRRMNFPE
ncbi:MAG: tetratricopeptide repeat protein, partial [Terriglobia bacterium]